MNKSILALASVVVITAVGFIVMNAGNDSQVAGVYCSPDGTLTDTMPIQSHRSYCIKSNASEMSYLPNTPAPFPFSIVDDQGNTLKDFALTHTKPMHVIVVRKDLANFQHVHPEYDSTSGRFTLSSITFPTDGQYRIFADFVPSGGQMGPDGMPLVVTISEDIAVGNISNYRPQALRNEERTKTFEGTQVTLSTMPQTLVAGMESMLTFSLSRDGKPITDLQEYLRALGHSVVLREDTLDFIHAHPMDDRTTDQNGKVEFMVSFPREGTYKVFTQFQRDGKVFTTDFVVSVGAGEGEMMDEMMPGRDHSMQP